MSVTQRADGWVVPDDPRDAWIRHSTDGTFESRFERFIPRPPEKVWGAITIPERIADWFGSPVEVDLRVGGKYLVLFPGEADDLVEGTITACEPPRLLEMEWFGTAGDTMLRWEIEPAAGGSRLVLHNRGSNAWWLLGGAAGWRDFVDAVVSIACDEKANPETHEEYIQEVEQYRRTYGPFVPGFDQRPALRHHEPTAFVTSAGERVYNIRYVRRWMLPIETVWAALTEPERLADWLCVAEIDLRVGGMIELTWPTVGHSERHVILELEPPNLMVWGSSDPQGPQSVIRWALYQEDPDFMGTRLVMTQTLIPARDLLSIATGWHAHLYELPEAALRELSQSWSADRERARAEREMAELSPRYRARLARDAPDAV